MTHFYQGVLLTLLVAPKNTQEKQLMGGLFKAQNLTVQSMVETAQAAELRNPEVNINSIFTR